MGKSTQIILGILWWGLFQFNANGEIPHLRTLDRDIFGHFVSRGQNSFDSLASHKLKQKFKAPCYGGLGIMVSHINDQMIILTGGRGAVILNNRYILGGAGWGTFNRIELDAGKVDTTEFFKLGYGGLDVGYLFYNGPRFSSGFTLLTGCGAGFRESIPKSKVNFGFFPVLEPVLFSRIKLNGSLRLDVGVSYRMVGGSGFSFISNRQLSGTSVFVALLIGSCK